jgi:alpha-ketoglutarate-dependent taurine dioxygenase
MAQLQYEQIKPKIGARVLNNKAELLSGDLSDAILDLMEKSGVLVFPTIDFTDAEQVAFTNALGDTVMWDHRSSLHRATPYDPFCGRMMHRTILGVTEGWDQAA